ncbi:hypothetical protein NHX12_006231 [Muraenolepis orangiensis]|uniref:Uncharacterized protein n=1 Tax=Muraenolepis orangiensis TaxID=630683 RepID=A0A9Q0DUP2_9TELE|nr:hypothetical protein NHX12_006231 [Muraenolepis orangiensis]
MATDEGGDVWDINDNAPVFTCMPSCHGYVAKSSLAGISVMEMTATDLDDSAVCHNAVLSYSTVGCLAATADGAFDHGEEEGVEGGGTSGHVNMFVDH